MKTYGLALIFALISFHATAQWNDVKIEQQGRERNRTQFMSYDRRDDATTYDFSKSPYFISLNGEWTFSEAENPAKADEAFYRYAFGGNKTTVPSFWTTAAKEELAAVKPPALPADNPVGQYVRKVDIPASWLDREFFIYIEGARSAVTVYVNGKKAGYSEDSATPSEFNITGLLTTGENIIGLEVYKWSDGSWLEGSSIGGAGVAGDVYLYSQPRLHIEDFIVDASLDSLYKTGKLTLDVIISNNYNMAENITVYFDLISIKGGNLRYNNRDVTVEGKSKDTIRFEMNVPNVEKWSDRNPSLYHLMVRFRHNGRFYEYIPYKIGFRKLETADDKLLVNGEPVIIKDTSILYSGINPGEKAIREELAKIKKAGYNAITCVYHPSKNTLYRLCAEYGIYVIDRINIDTSLTGRSMNEGGNIGNNPAWTDAFLSRGENSFYAYRNHTGLIRWTTGMNSGEGYNVYRLENRMLELDGSGRFARDTEDNY